ncbi:MAG: SdpI family protein [Isosphaerales bacterium]
MTRVYWIIAILLVAISAGAAAWLSSSLPEQIPTHWNIRGEVDGYGGKWTLFLFPAMMAGMLVLFYFLPALSPKHFEVDTSRSTYLYIMVLCTCLFGYMNGVILYVTHQTVAKEATFDLGRAFIAGLFLFFGLLGNVIGKVRKNFYIGVRVPWTLASDRVWNDTHRLAAWVWVAAGVIGFGMIVLGAPFVAAFAVLIVSAFIPVIYSFLHYKSLERRGAL